MTHVDVKDGNVDGAIKRFTQRVQRSGVPSKLKEKRSYAKPGVKRREAKKEAIRNSRKKNRY